MKRVLVKEVRQAWSAGQLDEDLKRQQFCLNFVAGQEWFASAGFAQRQRAFVEIYRDLLKILRVLNYGRVEVAFSKAA